MKNAFCFILEALFVHKIFTFFFLLFGDVYKTENVFQNLWRNSPVNKQLQYWYCSISHEVKVIRQGNLVSL